MIPFNPQRVVQRTRHIAALLGVWLCTLPALQAAPAPAAPEGDTGRYALSAASGTTAMAVTANPHATAAAVAMLRKGGSAMDAAIAAQAVLGLVEPQSSGLGGGAFLLYHDGENLISIDGREAAPASAHENRFLDGNGAPMNFHAAIRSGRAIGIPGVLAALDEGHRRHGRLPWRELFAPAITLARNGFPVSPRLHALMARDPLLRDSPSTRAYFFNADGQAHASGHVLTNPDYADALGRIARKGASDFYRGRLMKTQRAALNRAGADLATSDWRGYRARVTPALCAPYRQYRVCSAPPPAGGLTVLQTLRLLDGLVARDATERLHQLLDAERLGFADRQRYSADPAYVPVPVAPLLSDDYIAARRALITATSLQKAEAGVPAGLTPPWGTDGQLLENGTSHLVIVDAQGHWLSMTSSIEDAFGSRLMVNGMLFNNQLTDFSFRPQENGRPLANRVQGGKRPRSAMSPVIVLDATGRPVLATGSPGGSRIIGYVLRALTASLDDDMAPEEVVQLPHALSRNGPSEIEAALPPPIVTGLIDRGHELIHADMNSGLAIIRRTPQGLLQGAADPRREGRATGL